MPRNVYYTVVYGEVIVVKAKPTTTMKTIGNRFTKKIQSVQTAYVHSWRVNLKTQS